MSQAPPAQRATVAGRLPGEPEGVRNGLHAGWASLREALHALRPGARWLEEESETGALTCVNSTSSFAVSTQPESAATPRYIHGSCAMPPNGLGFARRRRA